MVNQNRTARIYSLDIARGFAVLWMLCCQLLDMFSFEYDLYSMKWMKYFSWIVLFMVVAGFSLQLAFKKYGVKRFYLKVGKRLVYFVCLSVFLSLWCGFGFGFGPLGLGVEILLWIGILSAICSLFFLVNTRLDTRFEKAYWFFMLMLIFFVFGYKNAFHNILDASHSFWLVAFMCFGVFLAYTLEDHLKANMIESNKTCGSTITAPLGIQARIKHNTIAIFSYFGRHALFFYFFHFAIFHKALTLMGLFKSFSLPQGILLTATALLSLIILLKAATKL